VSIRSGARVMVKPQRELVHFACIHWDGAYGFKQRTRCIVRDCKHYDYDWKWCYGMEDGSFAALG
jgi:hypothetical protein